MKAFTTQFTPGTPTEYDSTIKLTKDQAIQLGIDPTQDEQHGNMETRGPWNIPISFQAVCVSAKYEDLGYRTRITDKTVYGMRKMSDVRQCGYELEGRVSINGKKYTCFTSSQLFEVEGKLINVSTIHARIK